MGAQGSIGSMHWSLHALAWASLVLFVAHTLERLRVNGFVAPTGEHRPAFRTSVHPRPPCGLWGHVIRDAQPYDVLLEPFESDDARTCAEICAGVRDCDAWWFDTKTCRLYGEALGASENAAVEASVVGYAGGKEPAGCKGVYH